MSTPDLKPCPFCGAEAAYTEHEKTNETRGWCQRGCGAEGPFGARSLGPGWGDAMARDGWNIRPIEDALRARAKAAEAALATARAEGAAAERAAVVADLRSLAAAEDLCAAEAEMSENIGRGRVNGGAIVRRGAAALRAAAGVIEGRRPVEGA